MIPARVLVIDDEHIIAATIRQMLEERGYTVAGTAASAESAIRQVKEFRPDIVLMGIHLEGKMDGIDAAIQIEAEAGTPIIFLTASAEAETIRRASQCKDYSFLVKPVQAAELHAAIQIALSKHAFDHQLQRSERRLRLALDASSLAVWECDPAAGRVETSGPIDEILGPDRAPVSSCESLFSGIQPDDRPALDSFLNHTDGEARRELTFRILQADGSIRWIRAHASSFAERGSGAVRTIGTLRDITAQYENETRLRQAAALFETIGDAIAIVSPGLFITTTNPAFDRITGFSNGLAVGRHIGFLLSPIPVAGTRWQGEASCHRRQGDHLAVWLTVAPILDADAVTGVVFSFSDVTPLRRAEAGLAFLVHHDSLTGLPNRLLFDQRLDAMTAALGPFSLFYLDLDGFKLINDRRGHFTGDLVLQAVAARIRKFPDETGFAARLGSDEFAIVVPTLVTAADIDRFAAYLGAAIAAPLQIGNESITVTASIGISTFPDDGAGREMLLQTADTAMNAAKRDGPNAFLRYHAAIAGPHTDRYQIEQDIRRAFASSQLQLLYQPIVSLVDGSLTGAEALVRWRHPERGFLNPDRFISIAEDAGLIDELGEAVLRMACRDWMYWIDEAGPLPRLSINVSARQMASGKFPGLLRGVLAEFPLPPSCLEMEITESSFQTLECGQAFVSQLRDIGVSISMDDFGTGYSSLAALRDLQVDRIKMDRSFLPAGTPRENDIALLQAIVSIARAMNLKLTAEGIETAEQLELVRDVGCDEGQGYWLSHPLPFAAAVEVIRPREYEV